MRAYVRVRLGVAQSVRPFTDSEDDFITDLRIAGYGTTAIAEAVWTDLHVRRSPATINMRLKSLAAREEVGD